MKRLSALFLSLSLFLCPVIASAAISSAVEWEIRANGDVDNGGGFKSGASGTDYSQQDAAQESYTTLAMTTGGTTLTCSGGDTFDADIIGNIIRIDGGTNFTTGWYEVTARASSTEVTIDRDATNGSNASSGTGNMGGALFWNDTWADASNTLTAGQTVHVKADATQTLTANFSAQSISGSGSGLITFNGYNTTREDDPGGTNRPLIAAGANQFRFGDDYYIKNLEVTTTETSGFSINNRTIVENVYVNNSSGSSNRSAIKIIGNRGARVLRCEAESANGYGVWLENDAHTVIGSYIHDCGNTGIIHIAGLSAILFNIIDTCDVGISMGSFDYVNRIVGNTLYNGTTGIDISLNNTYSQTIWGNLIDSFTTGVSQDGTEESNYLDYNNFNNNTTDVSNISKGAHTTSADPEFTDAPNGDFSVGTNVKEMSFPGEFPGGLTTGYLDQGAVQRQEPAGGGTNASGAVSVAF